MSTTSGEVLRTDDELPAPKTELGRVQLEIGEIQNRLARGRSSASIIAIASAIAAIVGATLAVREIGKGAEELSKAATIEILITAAGIGGVICSRKISNPGNSDDESHLEILLWHEDLLIRQGAKSAEQQ